MRERDAEITVVGRANTLNLANIGVRCARSSLAPVDGEERAVSMTRNPEDSAAPAPREGLFGGPAPSSTGIANRDHGHRVYSTPGFCFANMIINPVKFDAFEIGSAQSAVAFVTVPALYSHHPRNPGQGWEGYSK